MILRNVHYACRWCGTKSALAYMYWKPRRPLGLEGIAQDAIVMNTDDVFVWCYRQYVVSSTIGGRKSGSRRGDCAIIDRTEEFLEKMRQLV
jgi:hypothetical protein